ncbi:uncharacterized protein LOC119734846 [Patiria miniata]|uniref:Uncharacterized protein n=1 Tax=Patiria miniata TaxID=46514 RepID=A0A914AK46_PATMI|nr:uncharacterized protein LOC119722155 [Patiria miniata]XP_038048142.1 uncharacterized protein LOC119722155 [Patiria miniata]XP_038064355.1 uncharacterized protein LOC119734846 [Patiria miniata]XP_038064357.1 uncharacterized protein LOC119734846 [Patiria miniata]
MPVKLLATNPFAEPARLEYEPSPSPAMRAYRWKRPLGVLPQYLKPSPTGRDAPKVPGRTNTRGRLYDARQLFTITQAATEHLRAATQMGYREETKSCDLEQYRIGAPAPPFGANNNSNNTNNASPKSKTQLPNIKPEESSRFEHRLGRHSYSRTEVLLKLQRRRKPRGKQGPATGSGKSGAGSQDFPVIDSKETNTCTCEANYVARMATRSDSGYLSKDSPGSKSQNASRKGRRVSSSVTSSTTIVTKMAPASRSDSSPCNSFGLVTKEELNPRTSCPKLEFDEAQVDSESSKRKLGFVEVATPLHRDPDTSGPESDDQERSTGTSSPVVSNDADSVCEELQKIVLRQAKHDPTCATPFGVRWREDLDDTPGSDDSDKNRFDRAMQALQPRVPHVVWPENRYYSPHTVFVYASPSRLAPVVIPSHSVDCPQCKFYQASPKGDICPPNSPTPWMEKEFGFYPVERHFGSKAEQ